MPAHRESAAGVRGRPFAAYARLILTLLVRENQQRATRPIEALMELSEPVVLATVFCAVRYMLDRLSKPPLGDSLILFYATGFFPDFLWIYVGRKMRGSIDLPGRRFPIVQRIDQIIAHLLLRSLEYTVLGIVVFGTIYFFITPLGYPYRLSNVILACLAIIILGFFWGIVTMIMNSLVWWWVYFMPILNRTLTLLSGAFFIPDFMSPGNRYIISYIPTAQAISLFRTGFYPDAPTLILDTTYLLTCCTIALFFGFLLERVTRRQE